MAARASVWGAPAAPAGPGGLPGRARALAPACSLCPCRGVDRGRRGGSARAIREAIDPAGTLHLIDPYPPGRLGVGLARLIARRVVREVPRGRVIWLRQRSQDAVTSWTKPIDFLFVDGDNSFEGVARDWADWSPHIRVGGVVVLEGARLTEGGWVTADYGPARLVREQVEDDPRWAAIDGADAAVALRRVA